MNLVWFKRDLRVRDHRPLAEALGRGPTLALYVLEPRWRAAREFSERHLAFVGESVRELASALAKLGVPLVIREGDFPEVLERLPSFRALFAHEETGVDWTFQRDREVRAWCRRRGIAVHEYRQFGVKRGAIDRDHWQKFRSETLVRREHLCRGQEWPSLEVAMDVVDWPAPLPLAQRGGEAEGLRVLEDFLYQRGAHYRGSISSPLSAQEGCSRLSPYLAWGNLSLTTVLTALEERRRSLHVLSALEQRRWLASLEAFESRLWWHCHFIQKLESEPELEWRNANRAFDGMRELDFDEQKFRAWCEGRTGFPLVDACMRSLIATGWVNFRMRAMLVSFAAYQLWLHWERPAQHLARLFLDFEPGIHFPQVQMQSGVTGINAIRIYSPEKQLAEQDPRGEFVRRWVPELAQRRELARDTPPLLEMLEAPSDYPAPIVDPRESYQRARERIFQWKRSPEARALARAVLEKHGSRKGPHFPHQQRE